MFVSLSQTDALSVSPSVCVCLFLMVLRGHRLLGNAPSMGNGTFRLKITCCVFQYLCYRNENTVDCLLQLCEQHLYILINPVLNAAVSVCSIMLVVLHVNDLGCTKGFVLRGTCSVSV